MFIWRKPIEGLQAPGVIVGVEEVGEVTPELIVECIVEAPHRRVFDRPVHSLDLSVGPWVTHLCQPVLDPVFLTAHGEHVGDEARSRTVPISGWQS